MSGEIIGQGGYYSIRLQTLRSGYGLDQTILRNNYRKAGSEKASNGNRGGGRKEVFEMNKNRSVMVFILGVAGLMLMLSGGDDALVAGANSGILYVSMTDPTCGGRSPCFASIQQAVDAAGDGDEIRVAAGAYTGTAPGVVNGKTYTQVVLISKSLTLQGGYTTADWETADPAAHPTVIDAQRQGRGISIVGDGDEMVTVAGFTITGGDYTGLGNPDGVGNQVCSRTGSDCGGGLFAHRVTLTLRDSIITDNIASRTRAYSDGGGAYLWALNADSRVENTRFDGNLIDGVGGTGGGMSITFGESVTIANSRFQENQTTGAGAGLQIFQPSGQVLIEDTAFIGNRSNAAGGALEARITYSGTALGLHRLTMQENQARGQGAAISLLKQGTGVSTIDMTNVLLAANSFASGTGAVINASGGSAGDMDLRLRHLTWANHFALVALRLSATSGRPITAVLTNALINSAGSAYAGNQEDGDVTIRHINTLTDRVGMLHFGEAGMPAFEAINPLTGNPMLDRNSHLLPGSAAIDTGVNSGVPDDLDGDPRPTGAGYDIGADEYVEAGGG